MKRNPFAMLGHSARMISRNLRGYAMLSITIVLSFSALLGYMSFSDSGLYNRYRGVFASPREIAMTYVYGEKAKIKAFMELVENEEPDAQKYLYVSASARLEQYDIAVEVFFMPSGSLPVYSWSIAESEQYDALLRPEELIKGTESFSLDGNQAIISESLYRALPGDGALPMKLRLPMAWTDGSEAFFELDVIGVCADNESSAVKQGEGGERVWYPNIYLSQSMLSGRSFEDIINPCYTVWSYSERPEIINLCAQKLGIPCMSVSARQDAALKELRSAVSAKALIAGAMFVLLGINLYGSFANALSDRKFEIGVKRALGAPAGAVVGQFFLESLFVMLADIAAAGVLVGDALIFYKGWRWFARGASWTVNVAPYSVELYLICAVSLALAFSLIFAWRSTQVEIAGYLKAE